MRVGVMHRCVIFIAVVLAASAAFADGDFLTNGGFEVDADSDGAADGWSFSGDPRRLKWRMSLEPGRTGRGKCQRLDCTEFRPGGGWTHVMVCQVSDRIAPKKGRWYTVRLWAKGERIDATIVRVGLRNSKPWAPLGLRAAFAPTRQWKQYEFHFRAERDGGKATRFQIWFMSTGTLWIDDVEIVETPGGTMAQRPALLHAAAGRKNLVPNASFEVGAYGWGSRSVKYTTWGSPMDRLFGDVVEIKDAPHGARCLRIALTPRSTPVAFFDYFEMHRDRILAPLAGHIGYVELKTGKPYVLSAWLRADAEGTPARIGVQYLSGWFQSKLVTVGRAWRRFTLGIRPKAAAGYVAVGPDLREAARKSATVWIDAIQLEAGRTATEFAPRDPIEIGLSTQHVNGIFGSPAVPKITVRVHNSGTEAVKPSLSLAVTDFDDATVATEALELGPIAPGGTAEAMVRPIPTRFGFYRVRLLRDGKPTRHNLRLAVIPKYERGDSVFGMNHAYGWDPLIEAANDIGLRWARDWSLKWQHIEPIKGKVDFTEADHQINRPIRLGQQVLGLIPFPSSDWSSEAPASVKVSRRYPQNRERIAYAPRDIDEFKEYVSRCVAHYKGRIRWWQCFNEPIYTSYSLPRKRGYKPADYVRLAKAFYAAVKRADSTCKVLAGPGGWAGEGESPLKTMIDAGLLDACDAVDLHIYPTARPPESLARDLKAVRKLMADAGGVKPIWITETGYYADDDFELIPPTRESGINNPLPSERVHAEWLIKFNLICLAGGVERILYHAGTAAPLNRDGGSNLFFEYGGAPRKVVPALAAFSRLFRPDVKFMIDLSKPGKLWALAFKSEGRVIVALWRAREAEPQKVTLNQTFIETVDLMGNRVEARELVLSDSPVFMIVKSVEKLPELRRLLEAVASSR